MDIKELRQSTRMTQKEFAEYFNIPQRTIENWEGGKRTPPEYVVELMEYKIKKEREEMKYYINYNTGAGNDYADTLKEAKEIAERNLAYTQESVTIEFDGEEVARLPWWGMTPQEDDVITEQFGDFGFYGGWSDDEEF